MTSYRIEDRRGRSKDCLSDIKGEILRWYWQVDAHLALSLPPATNPAHASRADAWGSRDAASTLPCKRNVHKISTRTVDTIRL
jgi:hypothetical protein